MLLFATAALALAAAASVSLAQPAPPVPLQCSGTVQLAGALEGTIVDHTGAPGSDYLNDADCEWRVVVPPRFNASGVSVRFAVFDTEAGFDTVTLESADGATSFVVSGSEPALTQRSWTLPGNVLVVRFQSDGSVTGRGFELIYAGQACSGDAAACGANGACFGTACVCDRGYSGAACEVAAPVQQCAGEQRVEALEGIAAAGSAIVSHTGPADYQNDAACRWVVAAPAGGAAANGYRVRFAALDTERRFDVVTVYEGVAGDGRARMFSGALDADVDSDYFDVPGEGFVVEFSSDGSVSASGFALEFVANSRQAALGTAACCPAAPAGAPADAFCFGATCVPCRSVPCDGGPAGCPAEGARTEASGTISDGPTFYGSAQHCSWRVTLPNVAADARRSITLRFDELGTERSFDTVSVTAADGSVSAFSGTLADLESPYVVLDGNEFAVDFQSDASVNGTGFVLAFSGVPCAVDCGAHGFCFDGACECEAGVTGAACDTFQCSAATCDAAHGACDAAGERCVCAPGRSGADCKRPRCDNGAVAVLRADDGGVIATNADGEAYGRDAACTWLVAPATAPAAGGFRLTPTRDVALEVDYDFLSVFGGASARGALPHDVVDALAASDEARELLGGAAALDALRAGDADGDGEPEPAPDAALTGTLPADSVAPLLVHGHWLVVHFDSDSSVQLGGAALHVEPLARAPTPAFAERAAALRLERLVADAVASVDADGVDALAAPLMLARAEDAVNAARLTAFDQCGNTGAIGFDAIRARGDEVLELAKQPYSAERYRQRYGDDDDDDDDDDDAAHKQKYDSSDDPAVHAVSHCRAAVHRAAEHAKDALKAHRSVVERRARAATRSALKKGRKP